MADTDPEPREFASWLLEHNKGRTHDELSQAMRNLVLAVHETGKGGTITLKISVKEFDDHTVGVTDHVAVKLPEADRGTSIFFSTESGDLVRDDPYQQSIFDIRKENA